MEERQELLIEVFNALISNTNFVYYLMGEENSHGNYENANIVVKANEELNTHPESLSLDVINYVNDNLYNIKNILDEYNKLEKEIEENENIQANEEIATPIFEEDTNSINENEIHEEIITPLFDDDENINNISNETIVNPEPVKNVIPVTDSLNQEQVIEEPVTPALNMDEQVNNQETISTNNTPSEPTISIQEQVRQNSSSIMYSSVIAKGLLTKELAEVTNNIKYLEETINNSKNVAPKKAYFELAQLMAWKENIIEIINQVNVHESFSKKTIENDLIINEIDAKAAEISASITGITSKLALKLKVSKLEHLQNKRNRIMAEQQNIIEGKIDSIYRTVYKATKRKSHELAYNWFYNDTVSKLEEKKEEVLNKIDESDNEIIGGLKETYYNLKALPYEKKIVKIAKMREKHCELKGFNKLKYKITKKPQIIEFQKLKEELLNIFTEEVEENNKISVM